MLRNILDIHLTLDLFGAVESAVDFVQALVDFLRAVDLVQLPADFAEALVDCARASAKEHWSERCRCPRLDDSLSTMSSAIVVMIVDGLADC